MLTWLNAAYLGTGSLAIWVAWAKVVGPRVKVRLSRFVGIFQTIAGRDPIIDKRTGVELSPEVPALGIQLASIDAKFGVVNENMAELIAVVKSNQDAHHRIDNVVARVDGHDTSIAALLAATFERGADKTLAAEQIKAAGVIDAESS